MIKKNINKLRRGFQLENLKKKTNKQTLICYTIFIAESGWFFDELLYHYVEVFEKNQTKTKPKKNEQQVKNVRHNHKNQIITFKLIVRVLNLMQKLTKIITKKNINPIIVILFRNRMHNGAQYDYLLNWLAVRECVVPWSVWYMIMDACGCGKCV